MKNWKYILRLIGIVTIGILLVQITYRFKYSSFVFDFIFFGILLLIGLIFLIWSLFTDLKQFKTDKKLLSLIPLGLGIVFASIILISNFHINADFNKPTLIRIFYDGDFNGTGIDFKTDGTYIFDNSAIGQNNYLYGEYKISGNRIILDKVNLDDVVVTNQLEIRPEIIKPPDQTEVQMYVYQTDKKGNILKDETKFRLVLDNRK